MYNGDAGTKALLLLAADDRTTATMDTRLT